MQLIFKLFLLFFTILSLNANQTPLQHVKLQLQWKHQFEFAGFYAAKELGYYRDVGLDVEFIEFEKTTNIVDEVISGKAQYGVTYSSLIADYCNGKPVVLLANFFKQSPLVLVAHENIKTVKDLKNKKIMGVSHSVNNISLLAMLQKFDIQHKDIKEVETTFNIDDFIEKKVDAMSIFTTNELYELNQKGIKYNLFDPLMYGAKYYDENLFTSNDELEKHPTRAKNFRDASIKGWIYALEHQEELVEIILQKYNTQNKSKKALLFEAKQTYQIMLPEIHMVGSVDINLVRNIADSFSQAGFSNKTLDKNIENFIYKKSISLLNLTKKEKEFIQNHPRIVLGTEKSWEPYVIVSKDGKISGYDADVLALVNEVSGANFTLKTGDWATMQIEAKNREIDGLSTGGVHEERKTYLNFSDTYVEMKKMLIVSKQNPNNINSTDDLKDKIIAVHRSNLVDAKTAKEFPQAIIKNFNSIEDVITSVISSESDVMFGNGATLYLANKIGTPYLKYTGSLPTSLKLSFGVRNDWDEAIGIINKSLKHIGKHKLLELKNRWFFTQSPQNNELTQLEKQYLSTRNEISMCIDSNWMPFEAYKDGVYTGLNSDYIKIYEKNMGVPIKIYETKNWQHSTQAVKQKKCDLLSMVMKTKDREKYLNFPTPYLQVNSVIATSTDKVSVLDISYLKDKKVAVVANSSLQNIIATNYPNIQIIEVHNIKDGLALVRDEKVYGYAGSSIAIKYYFENSTQLDIKISAYFDEKMHLGFGVRDDDIILSNILDKITRTITDEQKQAIMKKWFSVIYKNKVDYTIFYILFILIIIILAFMLYKAYITKKLNQELQNRVQVELDKSREKDKILFQQNKLAAMGEMLENIAHQWRQPLSQINSSVLIIDDILDENKFRNSEVEDKLLEIESLTKYLSNTINDFKDFFAQDKDKKMFYFRETIEKAIDIVQGSFKKYRIDIVLFIDENLSCTNYENELQQVIVVILNNAKDAFIERNISTPTIKISVEKKDDLYVINICDNAGGITKKTQAKIFQPYFTTKHKSQGTGIGLYMSKKIIDESLQGELSVTNSELGVCFKIKLKADDGN